MRDEREESSDGLNSVDVTTALEREYSRNGHFSPGEKPPYPPLEKALDMESTRLRLAAVSMLASTEGERSLLLLKSAAWDWYLPVRVLAVKILEEMGESSTKETFMALAHSEDFNVRFDALRLLAQLEDRSLLPIFRSAMDSPDPRISTLACEAVFSLGDRSGLGSLIKKLLSGTYEERIEAAGFLATMEDIEAERAVDGFLGSEDIPISLKEAVSSSLQRARRRKN